MAGSSISMIDRTSGDGRSRQPNPEPHPKKPAACIDRDCIDRAESKKETNGNAPVEHDCNGDGFADLVMGRRPRTALKHRSKPYNQADLDWVIHCANGFQ